MENKSHAFRAGLFTLTLLAAIALVAFWFSVDHTVRAPYDVIARTNVTGLSAEAAVRYRGLTVGKVARIDFDAAHPGQVVIRILVDQNTPMTHSTYASLGFQGVTGIAFLQLDDDGVNPAPLSSSPAHVARLDLRPGLLDSLQARGTALLGAVQQVTVELNQLLGDDSRRQLLRTARSLQQAADGVSTLTRQAAPALGKLPGALDQLDRTLASTDALARGLNDPNGPLLANLNRAGQAAQQSGEAVAQLNRTLQELASRVSYDTLPRVNALADDARASLHAFDRAAYAFSDNPRSVLFGVPAALPGPGEPSFSWGARR